jgi:hypothetical protein
MEYIYSDDSDYDDYDDDYEYEDSIYTKTNWDWWIANFLNPANFKFNSKDQYYDYLNDVREFKFKYNIK